MKRFVAMVPLGFATTMPSHGKNCDVEPDLSFCQCAWSVRDVFASGRQVSDGAISARSSGT